MGTVIIHEKAGFMCGVLFLLRDLPSVYLMQENGPVLVRKALPSWRLV